MYGHGPHPIIYIAINRILQNLLSQKQYKILITYKIILHYPFNYFFIYIFNGCSERYITRRLRQN